MNIEQCEKRNDALFAAAVRWAECETDNSGERLEPQEIAIICEMLDLVPPKCLYKLVYTDSPTHANASGAYKEIFAFLNKLKRNLLKSS